jgi:hypothetical protein
MTQINLRQVHSKILLMQKTAEELSQMGREFPALARNTARILASLKMLAINVSDIVKLESDE